MLHPACVLQLDLCQGLAAEGRRGPLSTCTTMRTFQVCPQCAVRGYAAEEVLSMLHSHSKETAAGRTETWEEFSLAQLMQRSAANTRGEMTAKHATP